MISPVEIEIEIALHAQEKKYEVDLHFDRSDSEADTAPIRGETGLDLEALRALSDDRTEYGKALYQDVFADPKIRSGFENGCAVAEASEMPVRARLLIDQNAPELHALCWEALRDPKNGELIVTRERLLFSRFLSADDWRPVRFRARDEFARACRNRESIKYRRLHSRVADRCRRSMFPEKPSAPRMASEKFHRSFCPLLAARASTES